MKRSETLFQTLVTMLRKASETASFLVELIFESINSLQKESVKRDLFSSRDCVETLCLFAVKCFRAETFPCRFVSNHVVSFQTVLQCHGLNIRLSCFETCRDHSLNISRPYDHNLNIGYACPRARLVTAERGESLTIQVEPTY